MQNQTRILQSNSWGASLAPLALAIVCLSCGRNPSTSDHLGTGDVIRQESRIRSIKPGKSIEREIRPGEIHDYKLTLDAGGGCSIDVQQAGADVVVELIGPKGESLEVDTPVGSYGPEHVCWIAPPSGEQKLRIRLFERSAGGRYVLRLGLQNPVSQRERNCQAAMRIFTIAERESYLTGFDPERLAFLYKRASALWAGASGHRFQQALALREGAKALNARGELSKESRMLEEALRLLQLEGERGQQAILLNLLGLNRLYQAEPAKARAQFEQARVLAVEAGRPDVEAGAWNNLALLAASLGDPYSAVELYERALGIWSTLDVQQSVALAVFNLGVAHTDLGDFDVASDLLRQALEKYQQIGDPTYQAASLSALGWVHFLEGEAAQAVEYFQDAFALAHEVGNRRREAEALDRMGSAYKALGQPERAREAFETALGVVSELGNERDIAHSTANLGWLLAENDDPGAADAKLELARRLFSRLGDRDGLAHTLAGLAVAKRAEGHLSDARRYFELALEVVRSLRLTARRRGMFAPSHTIWQDYYERYVDLLIEISVTDNQPKALVRAFESSDLARAHNFYELLLESEIDLRHGIDPILLERERDILDRLLAADGRHFSSHGEFRRHAESGLANRRIQELLLELEQARAEIRRASPRFSEISEPHAVPVGEIQQHLEGGDLLLSFSLGERRSFLFALTRDSLKVYRLPPRKEIEVVARSVYDGLQSYRRRIGRRQLEQTTGALAELVLSPVSPELDKANRLLIVSEGSLLYIPFSTLPMPGKKGALVVDELEVVNLPLASALVALRRRAQSRRVPAKLLAIFADPVFSSDDPRLRELQPTVDTSDSHQSSPLSVALDLPRLPASRREAEEILALVSDDESFSALDFAANRDQVTSGTLANFRILHFATHAVIDDHHPQLSGLALSRFDEQGRPLAGFLRLPEIFMLDLPADLIVLSACSTALGEHRRGEGMVGLTRGFFYAGASRLVVSLWNVPDDATAELMIEFYRGFLREGLSAAKALRQAQLRLRQRRPGRPPYEWAGFVIQGLG